MLKKMVFWVFVFCTFVFSIAMPPIGASQPVGQFDSIDWRYTTFSANNTPVSQTSRFSGNHIMKIKLALMSFTENCKMGGGCYVSETNEIAYFSVSEMGQKGGGYPKIDAANAVWLDKVLSSLPPEPPLPPKPRRVLVSIPGGDAWRTRIYDRANMPEEILDLSRITMKSVPSFVLSINPVAEVQAYLMQMGDGGLALSPDGKVLVCRPWYSNLKIWNPITHEESYSTDVKSGTTEGLIFSPNGRYLVEVEWDKIIILNTADWKQVAELQTPYRRNCIVGTVNFTADGNFLVVSYPKGIITFRVSDWRAVNLPGMPEDTTALFPSDDGKWLIIVRANEITELWSAKTKIAHAKIAIEGPALLASFSPDHRKVAIASSYKDNQKGSLFHIGVFEISTGKLMYAFSPNEMEYMESVEALLWSPDSQYLMGVTKSNNFFTSRNVNVWNADTGRHRGDFTGCPTQITGIALTPDGKTLIAGCTDGKIRFWDFAAGIVKIKDFEASFTAQSK